MEKTSVDSSSDVIALLQEQNQLLKQLLDLQKKEAAHETHREWFMIFLKLVPYIIIAVLLVWTYLSVSSYLEQINQQIGVIRTNIDGVFNIVSAQFEFLKTMFDKLGDALGGIVPSFSGIADKVKEALPKF